MRRFEEQAPAKVSSSVRSSASRPSMGALASPAVRRPVRDRGPVARQAATGSALPLAITGGKLLVVDGACR